MEPQSPLNLSLSYRALAASPTQLDMLLASAEQALARAEESLQRACRTRILRRLPLDTITFDAVILDRYPEQNQQS